MEIGCFAYYYALANLGGYEAALIVRHESPERHYRIAVSSLWKEILLWRPTGGVLQVEPYPFEAGKSYDVSVACQGPHLTVSINGQEVINWWDTAEPVLKGHVGVARKEGESLFTAVKVVALPRQRQSAPPHAPQFRELVWHNHRWFFDGKGPVFVLTSSNVLDNMKFQPGYRPILYTFNYITDWSRFTPSKITDSKVVEDGSRLVFDTVAVDPNTKSTVTCTTHLVVTYDPLARMYNYDQDCTIDLSVEESSKVATSWDHGDAVFLGGVGSEQTADPKAFRALYQWSVFQADDGKYYKVPFNHNGHYLSTAASNGGPFNPNGGIWVVAGDPVVNPVVKVRGMSPGHTKVSVGHCWWAYDMHTMFHPQLVGNTVPAGQYVSKVRYTGMEASEAARLLAEAQFYQPIDVNVKIPVYTAGVGFTERFDKEVLLASPHQEHWIRAGVIDRSVGHDDKCSLRLDGPTEAWAITGSSYFMSGYGKRNRVTAWVKTEDVQGEGPTIGFRRWDDNVGDFYCSGITGTRDWTKVEFFTTKEPDHWGVTLYFRNSGTGRAWIDDLRIEAEPENLNVTGDPVQHYPVNPKDPDLVLHWRGSGDGNGVLDQSRYGHHGKLYGGAGWVEEDGKRVINLDGTGYIWPLCSSNLTLAPPCTTVFDLKPKGSGSLLFWGWNFNYYLTGGPPQFGVAYQLGSGKMVTSRPFLKSGQWQKLAVVAADKQVKVYCDGVFVEAIPAELIRGDWSLHTATTWHRHQSFFGGGPGDMALAKADPAYCIKGLLASLSIYRKALSDEEIGRLVQN
ncbi:MAG: LamG domain-containing protein [Armatimonadetes bacterium]|nr:LamG domain-containing protein [Armatimonadota bacterium]PIU61566.1 MAG: hypothetical protein COS85_20715 [Armatimonadetes bacterium CG07_land_8_20_14_0_80_59_28]